MNFPTASFKAGRQRGGALIVGLVLLAVLTMLGVAGMKTSIMELTMAGNKQFSEDAFQAAETGIDRALQAGAFNTATPTVVPKALVIPAHNTAVESRTEFKRNTRVPEGGFSLGEDGFEAYHFEVMSTGSAPRNAVSTHRQWFYIVGPDA